MSTKVNRVTVDLSQYPRLVVMYLGMRVNRLTGLKTLLGFGPKISDSVTEQPDGLLSHENMFYSLFPMHMFGAARRVARASGAEPVVSEKELYGP